MERPLNIFKFFLLATAISVFFPVGSISASKVEDIVTALELDHDQLAKLQQGEIVVYEVAEATQKELAVGLSMYLDVPPAKLVKFFKRGDLATVDPDVLSFQEIAENDTDPFKEFIFTPDQADEARNLLMAKPGNRFNLSSEEIKSFESLRKNSTGWSEENLIKAVSEHYQQILLQRLQKYRKQGLVGIASYARKKNEVNPAEELRIAARNSKLLAPFPTDLRESWLNYPPQLPPGTEERFFWFNRKVNNRPTATLSHRVQFYSENASVFITRQFFVGHSYNSSHLIVGYLPYGDGSIIFYTHRTSTDQVAGVGKKLKHNIGREYMKKQMIINLNRLKAAVRASKPGK